MLLLLCFRHRVETQLISSESQSLIGITFNFSVLDYLRLAPKNTTLLMEENTQAANDVSSRSSARLVGK